MSPESGSTTADVRGPTPVSWLPGLRPNREPARGVRRSYQPCDFFVRRPSKSAKARAKRRDRGSESEAVYGSQGAIRAGVAPSAWALRGLPEVVLEGVEALSGRAEKPHHTRVDGSALLADRRTSAGTGNDERGDATDQEPERQGLELRRPFLPVDARDRSSLGVSDRRSPASGLRRRRVICDAQLTTDKVRQIQMALKDKGFDPGPKESSRAEQTS